jgi:protein tyrosine/serine phosphatase
MKWLKYYPLFFLYEQSSNTIQRGTDPWEYKVDNNEWFTRKKGKSKWINITTSKYQTALDTLDKENPQLRTNDAPLKTIKTNQVTTKTEDPIQLTEKPEDNQIVKDFKPEEKKPIVKTSVTDSYLTKEFNFHLIPDNKNNYRSAQLPISYQGKEVLGDVIDKYGIKTIIRFNGNGKDGRNKKSHPITTINEEKDLATSKGIKFYKLSSTRDQDKVNQLLSNGNVLIHCAHGADRTGGNVGGYLYKIGWGDTEKIWDYSTQYSSWKSLIKTNPEGFIKHGYLDQLKKFGVKDLDQVIKFDEKKPRQSTQSIIRDKVKVCAHITSFKGGSSAENCLKNIQSLATNNTYMVEVDVQITKDGIPVLFHDNTLNDKTNGSGKISNLTWDEVKTIKYNKDPSQTITSLQSAIEAIKGSSTILQLDKCDTSELQIINNLGIVKGVEKQILAKGFSMTPPSIVTNMGIQWMTILDSGYVGRVTTKEIADEIVSKVNSPYLEYQFSDNDTFITNGYLSDELRKKGVMSMVVAVGGSKLTNGQSYRGDNQTTWNKIMTDIKPDIIMTNNPNGLS